jgi:hypothetical protein
MSKFSLQPLLDRAEKRAGEVFCKEGAEFCIGQCLWNQCGFAEVRYVQSSMSRAMRKCTQAANPNSYTQHSRSPQTSTGNGSESDVDKERLILDST